jgi:hypothetical protein
MVKWLARLVSLMVLANFGVLLAAVLTNEDPPEPAGMPIVILMAMTIALCVASWRWARAGGVLLLVTAVLLAAAALNSTATFGLGPEGLLVAAIYSLPVLVAGGLFAASGGTTRLNRTT